MFFCAALSASGLALSHSLNLLPEPTIIVIAGAGLFAGGRRQSRAAAARQCIVKPESPAKELKPLN